MKIIVTNAQHGLDHEHILVNWQRRAGEKSIVDWAEEFSREDYTCWSDAEKSASGGGI